MKKYIKVENLNRYIRKSVHLENNTKYRGCEVKLFYGNYEGIKNSIFAYSEHIRLDGSFPYKNKDQNIKEGHTWVVAIISERTKSLRFTSDTSIYLKGFKKSGITKLT